MPWSVTSEPFKPFGSQPYFEPLPGQQHAPWQLTHKPAASGGGQPQPSAPGPGTGAYGNWPEYSQPDMPNIQLGLPNDQAWDSIWNLIGNVPQMPNMAQTPYPELPQYSPVSLPDSIGRPNIPQYDMVQQPGSITPMQLSPMGDIQRPGQLQQPNIPQVGGFDMPQLPSADMSQWMSGFQPQQLQSPQLGQPMQLPTPQLQNPSLGQGYSPSDLMGAMPSYESPDWGSLFSAGSATPITAPQFQQQSQIPSGVNIAGGVNPMPAPAAPVAGPMPSVSGLGGLAGQTAAASANQAIGPAMTGMTDQWFQNRAAYDNAAQNAMAQSGLGWGSLWNQGQDIMSGANNQRQTQTLGWLTGMFGGI